MSARAAAEAEGLHEVFLAAGFDWREAGCSMCLAMNPDKLAAGERSASTSNRNFEGRQGPGGRTHLVSPASPPPPPATSPPPPTCRPLPDGDLIMEAFTTHTGRAVPLRRSNVDTDQIIPAVWLKQVSRTGFERGLFSAWREDPSFVLNDPVYQGASVLVTGPDFGTGSSREHAVWALQQYGFRAVIAPRFGDIFRGNSTKAGLLPVILPEATVAALQDAIEADPATEVVVDLDNRVVTAEAAGIKASFEIDDYTRWRLMEGLDDI